MITVSPILRTDFLILQFNLSFIALVLCLVSFIGIYRTKKTPYATKLLSLGLLVYDCLFLLSANVGKFFSFQDAFIFRYSSRGFQTAAVIIVSFMALERLFVIRWPYEYLRVATKRRTRITCLGIIAFSFLQYILIRTLVCYTRANISDCGVAPAVYFVLMCIVCLVFSVTSYVLIFKIIRRGEPIKGVLKQHKGTAASCLYLLNSACSLFIYLGLAVNYMFFVPKNNGAAGDIVNITDFAYVLNCIIDPLIYVLWFKETRLEILRMLSYICPRLQPVVEKMRLEVFNIIQYVYSSNATDYKARSSDQKSFNCARETPTAIYYGTNEPNIAKKVDDSEKLEKKNIILENIVKNKSEDDKGLTTIIESTEHKGKRSSQSREEEVIASAQNEQPDEQHKKADEQNKEFDKQRKKLNVQHEQPDTQEEQPDERDVKQTDRYKQPNKQHERLDEQHKQNGNHQEQPYNESEKKTNSIHRQGSGH